MRIGILPTVDVVFKRIFGYPGQENLTLHFLNDLLPLVGRPKAVSLDILNPFSWAEFKGEKEIAVDVHVRDEGQREFQIEMQVRSEGASAARMFDNWARLYSSQIARGQDYDKHHPVIAIWIFGNDFFPDTEEWLHRIEPVDHATGADFGDEFLLVAIELGKRAALAGFDRGAILKPGMDRWLAMLARGQDIDPEDAEVGSMDADMREVLRIMEGFTKSQKARYTYDRRMEWLSVTKGLERRNFEAGKAEGRAEGQGIKALEAASTLKRLGVAVETIAEATGLSLEEVASLQESG